MGYVGMFAAIVVFLFDLIAFMICDGWYVHALLAYFFLFLLEKHEHEFWSEANVTCTLFLLLMQDGLRFAHVGLSLSYVLPLALLSWYGKRIVIYAPWTLIHLLLPAALLADGVLMNYYFSLPNCNFYLSIQKIFITLGIGYLILLGMRGSRFFALYWAGKRKVWTPYR